MGTSYYRPFLSDGSLDLLDMPDDSDKEKKAKVWGACHQMKLIWKSDYMRRELKVRLFMATVESILVSVENQLHNGT